MCCSCCLQQCPALAQLQTLNVSNLGSHVAHFIFAARMQTVPFEKVAAAEATEFAAALAVRAPKGAEIGSAAFDEWLLEQNSASSVSSERMPLVLTFCRLVLWHHKRIAVLRKRGAYVSEQGFDGGVPCSVTGEVVHFAVLLVDEASRPLSLRAHLLREEGSGENAKPISAAVVFVHERFGFYVDLAKHLCKVCASKVRFVCVACLCIVSLWVSASTSTPHAQWHSV
jgi:hypothetical protein